MTALPALLFLIAPKASDAPLHLSPYGLKTQIVVVASELPTDFEKPEGAEFLKTTDRAPEGIQFLKSEGEQPSAGKVGVYVPQGAIFQITKRAMVNAGQGKVTLRLAKSPTREARFRELEKGGGRADYNEWLRCAMQRTSRDIWPPRKPSDPNVPKGTLVIVGGGGMPSAISRRFIEAGGGEDGKFVILPISMPDPINTAAEEDNLRRMGAKNVTVVPFREKDQLEDPKILEVFKNATGIWFGGGRQWNFVDAYEGTKLPALMRDVLSRGGVIGGSSAGATIQGDYMVRGAPAGPQIMMCEGYEKALGFLPGVAIDQHFSARNRFKDMTALMKTYPQFLGIGLDEATAIVVQGQVAEIMGRGKVHFYDTKKSRKDGEADYDAYPAGTRYDLKHRKVL
jgi:cyanophycinase